MIEDEPVIAEGLVRILSRESYACEVADRAETGLELARELQADLVLLDISLPGMDGIEACRRLREFSDAYVIMITGRASEIDRVVGLTAGADDYLSKPFSHAELMARIRAMRRRPRSVGRAQTAVRKFGDLTVDPDAREVTVAGEPVELSRIEFDLLAALAEHPRTSLSRRRLLERVWGENWFGDDHVIDVHVSNLRRKLGDDPSKPRYIRTVRGHGYRMVSG